MKKLLLVIMVCLLSLSLCADHSFNLVNKKPLYPISIVDPVSSLTGIHYFYETKSEKTNDIYLYNKDSFKYERYAYRDWDSSFLHNVMLSAGGYFSLCRFSFDNFQIEFVGEAGINSVFSLGSQAEMLGFDGTFLGGFNISLFNTFAIQTAIKHYSSHWGDELLLRSDSSRNKFNNGPDSYSRWEYIRDNNIRIGIAYTGSDRFNIRTSVEFPPKYSQLRPYLDAPDYMMDSNEGIPYSQVKWEKFTKRGELGSSYKALIIQAEAQYIQPINRYLKLIQI